jgi:tetratricopeptide (TPR) repeat protein
VDDILKAIAANDPEALKQAVMNYAETTEPPEGGFWHGPGIPVDTLGTQRHKIWNTPPNWLGMLFYNVGNDCRREHKWELAAVMFSEAIKAGFNDPSAHNNLAAMLKRLGRYDEARDIYLQIIANYPEYVPAYARLAIMLEAYKVTSNVAPEEYLREYFRRGGDMSQLQAFVRGTPPAEAYALMRLLGRL